MPINISLEPVPQQPESTLRYLVNNFNRIRDAFAKIWDSTLNWSDSAKSFGGVPNWSPLIQQGAVVAYNAGSSIIEYTMIGDTVLGYFSLIVTGAGTAGSPILISCPVTPKHNTVSVGDGWHFGPGGLNAIPGGPLAINSTSFSWVVTTGFYSPGGGNQLAAGHSLNGHFMYQAA